MIHTPAMGLYRPTKIQVYNVRAYLIAVSNDLKIQAKDRSSAREGNLQA